ncbi:hypothetical protein WP3W18E02_25560 [Klebsiella sp. WP3-W18-ESBL-02]|nr:hypothetical protein WP3W18E02_25560 [Klebsiella sp. WP3-W18-ESBL-02]BBR20980.1 hypothetical protein WP3S18E05_24600 [Klebsiella sp. WP3-S18-ESBL-05]
MPYNIETSLLQTFGSRSSGLWNHENQRFWR